MSKTLLCLSCAAGALAAALGSTAARAQTDNRQPVDVGVVIVEAERRSVSVQDVPVAISAYTSADRDRIGILSIGDLTNFTPGFAYSSSTDRPSIRGISRLTNNFAVDNGVSTYSDGVWTNSTLAAASTPLMVQRTEILRGPQGTLYGRNSIGGAINVISRRPTRDFYAEVRATVGSYGLYSIQGAMSGPLTDNLRFRVLALYNRQNEGFYTNVADGSTEGGRGENYYLEAQLDFNVGETFEAWAKINTFWFNDIGRAGYQLGPYDQAQFTTGSLGPGNGYGFTQAQLVQRGTVTTNPANVDHHLFNTNTPTINRLRNNFGATVHLTWHQPSFDIRYIGGYQTYDYVGTTDFDGTPVISYLYPNSVPGSSTTIFPSAIFDYQEYRQWYSNEINFVSTGGGPLQWIGGFFQYREDYEQPFFIHGGAPQLANPVISTFCGFNNLNGCRGGAPLFYPYTTPTAAAPQPDQSIYQTNTVGSATSYAAFVQFDYSFTEQLRATFGIRYTHDAKDLIESERLLCFGVVPFGCPSIDNTFLGFAIATPPAVATDITARTTAPAPGADIGSYNIATGQLSRRLHDNWSAWTGTLGLQWQPNPDTLIYARYSRGYKAGGFNTGAAAPLQALPEVNQETINAYEVGFKREFGRVFVFNVSAFFYDYQDVQAPFTVVPAQGPAFSQFINIPQSHNVGVEIETTWSPIRNLQIIANYAYLSAEIQDGGGCYTDPLDPTAALPTAQPCPAGGQRIEGRQLPAVTPHKVALNANYTWNFEPGDFTVSATYIWKDRTPYAIFGNPNTYAPSYSQADLRAQFRSRDGHYTVTLYGRNILDDEGYEGAAAVRQTNGQVYRGFTITPPRTYGVELQYRF